MGSLFHHLLAHGVLTFLGPAARDRALNALFGHPKFYKKQNDSKMMRLVEDMLKEDSVPAPWTAVYEARNDRW